MRPTLEIAKPAVSVETRAIDHKFGLEKSECEEFLQRHKSSNQHRPMMIPVDINTFHHFLGKVKQSEPNMLYVEWGSGGSTYVALQYASHVISFENDNDWCKVMTRDKFIQCNVVVGNLQFICPDGGKTVGFGIPANATSYNSLPYIEALQIHNYEPDFVFIDGRFRVASALGNLFFLSVQRLKFRVLFTLKILRLHTIFRGWGVGGLSIGVNLMFIN